MKLDPGLKMRFDILLQAAEAQIGELLRRHGWVVEIENAEQPAEYAVVCATRYGVTRRAALLYSSATNNSVYRHLEQICDVTLINGELYKLDSYAYGLKTAPLPVSDFARHLGDWNRDSAPEKIAPNEAAPEDSSSDLPLPRSRKLLSETPLDAIWIRMSRLESTMLARKAVRRRAHMAGATLTDDVARSKGDGIAYAIRNAHDYFASRAEGSTSQRVLNMYYGCMSLVFAEMLASPEGPTELARIEDMTRRGHGLWTFDGDPDGFGGLAVGLAKPGFFTEWLEFLKVPPPIMMRSKPKRVEDIRASPRGSWASLENLFAHIPEVGDLFEDVFNGPPAWATAVYDVTRSGRTTGLFNTGSPLEISYITLVDDSSRMTPEDMARLPGPIREIRLTRSESKSRTFSAAVDHPGKKFWYEALQLHNSPFERNALIEPLFGSVNHYRAVVMATLYGLSIMVRYRPSLWRQIQEGDLDNLKALIDAFLTVAERILPEQFLESVTGERTFVAQPGTLF